MNPASNPDLESASTRTSDKKIIVVTGARGFVGSNLAPYLEEMGYHVVKVSLRETGWRIPAYAHAVIHLAGLAHDVHGVRKAQEYFAVNADLTREVLEASLVAGISKFIFISSVKAVCDSPGESVLDESWEPTPSTPYGCSKRMAEQHILAAAARCEGDESFYVLRPCMIHGPRNRGNLNLLYRWVLSGIPYPLGAFKNSRSFLSIDNLNFVVGQFCMRSVPGGIYHVADDQPLSTEQVVRRISAAIGRSERIWNIPPMWIQRLTDICTLFGMKAPANILRKLTGSYRVSNRKLVKALGQTLPLTAEEGLDRTLQAFVLTSTVQVDA